MVNVVLSLLLPIKAEQQKKGNQLNGSNPSLSSTRTALPDQFCPATFQQLKLIHKLYTRGEFHILCFLNLNKQPQQPSRQTIKRVRKHCRRACCGLVSTGDLDSVSSSGQRNKLLTNNRRKSLPFRQVYPSPEPTHTSLQLFVEWVITTQFFTLEATMQRHTEDKAGRVHAQTN